MIIILCAPSGSGKSTMVKHLLETYPGQYELSISATTRAPRGQEQHGKEYYFISREEFEQQLQLVGARLKEETASSNRQSITELMTPYKQQLEELKKQSGENRASLETHIQTLVQTGGKLSHEADRLARQAVRRMAKS